MIPRVRGNGSLSEVASQGYLNEFRLSLMLGVGIPSIILLYLIILLRCSRAQTDLFFVW